MRRKTYLDKYVLRSARPETGALCTLDQFRYTPNQFSIRIGSRLRNECTQFAESVRTRREETRWISSIGKRFEQRH